MENADELILNVDIYSKNFKIKNQLLDNEHSIVCGDCNKLFSTEDLKDSNVETTLWDSDKFYCSSCFKEKEVLKELCNKYGSELIEVIRNKLNKVRNNSKSINREFSITVLDVMKLYDKQDGKCAVSGIPMTLYSKLGAYSTGVSIDRIDSSKGYVKDNIQLVCIIVNTMKTAMSTDEFLNICKVITENNCKLKNKLLSL